MFTPASPAQRAKLPSLLSLTGRRYGIAGIARKRETSPDGAAPGQRECRTLANHPDGAAGTGTPTSGQSSRWWGPARSGVARAAPYPLQEL